MQQQSTQELCFNSQSWQIPNPATWQLAGAVVFAIHGLMFKKKKKREKFIKMSCFGHWWAIDLLQLDSNYLSVSDIVNHHLTHQLN